MNCFDIGSAFHAECRSGPIDGTRGAWTPLTRGWAADREPDVPTRTDPYYREPRAIPELVRRMRDMGPLTAGRTLTWYCERTEFLSYREFREQAPSYSELLMSYREAFGCYPAVALNKQSVRSAITDERKRKEEDTRARCSVALNLAAQAERVDRARQEIARLKARVVAAEASRQKRPDRAADERVQIWTNRWKAAVRDARRFLPAEDWGTENVAADDRPTGPSPWDRTQLVLLENACLAADEFATRCESIFGPSHEYTRLACARAEIAQFVSSALERGDVQAIQARTSFMTPTERDAVQQAVWRWQLARGRPA